MKLFHNLSFPFGIIEASGKFTRVDSILTQKFKTNCPCKRHAMGSAKFNCAQGPVVGVAEESVVLIGSGEISIDIGNHGSGKRTDCFRRRGRRNQISCAFEQLDCLPMTAGEVMEPSFNGQSVSSLQRIHIGI